MPITTTPDRGEPRETKQESRSGDRGHGQAGFSLVELLVVLAIIVLQGVLPR